MLACVIEQGNLLPLVDVGRCMHVTVMLFFSQVPDRDELNDHQAGPMFRFGAKHSLSDRTMHL
jgi:hypothetical protein